MKKLKVLQQHISGLVIIIVCMLLLMRLLYQLNRQNISHLLDETADVSRQEQVSFILRYVNGYVKINEHFIGVTGVKQTDHETVTLAIKETFQKYGHSLQDL